MTRRFTKFYFIFVCYCFICWSSFIQDVSTHLRQEIHLQTKTKHNYKTYISDKVTIFFFGKNNNINICIHIFGNKNIIFNHRQRCSRNPSLLTHSWCVNNTQRGNPCFVNPPTVRPLSVLIILSPKMYFLYIVFSHCGYSYQTRTWFVAILGRYQPVSTLCPNQQQHIIYQPDPGWMSFVSGVPSLS